MKHNKLLNTLICVFIAMVFSSSIVNAKPEGVLNPGMVNPGHVEHPAWFKVSFLDLFEDIEDAAENDKRLLVYYYQDGCPYCKKLIEENFSQREIAEKTKKYFDVVSINLWGDKDVTVGDRDYTEKEFAEALKVQYTPTLLFFDENKKIIFRANGYYPPEKFSALLDYIGKKQETKLSYQEYIEKVSPQASTGRLHNDINTVATAADLSKSNKPLLVMFEQKNCSACDELHLDVLKRKESIELLEKFDIVILDMWSSDELVTPAGKKITIRNWAKKLGIQYTPSLVFFDNKSEEVFRSDAYLKSFHIQSVLDYVSSGMYKKQSNFQRYVDSRAYRFRDQGIEVNLMD